MPKGAYAVQRQRRANLDSSFRSCVVTLLAFIFLCLILILVAYLVRKGGGDGAENGDLAPDAAGDQGGRRGGRPPHTSTSRPRWRPAEEEEPSEPSELPPEPSTTRPVQRTTTHYSRWKAFREKGVSTDSPTSPTTSPTTPTPTTTSTTTPTTMLTSISTTAPTTSTSTSTPTPTPGSTREPARKALPLRPRPTEPPATDAATELTTPEPSTEPSTERAELAVDDVWVWEVAAGPADASTGTAGGSDRGSSPGPGTADGSDRDSSPGTADGSDRDSSLGPGPGTAPPDRGAFGSTPGSVTETEPASTPASEAVTDDTAADSATALARSATETSMAVTAATERRCEAVACKRLAGRMLATMGHDRPACSNLYEWACGGLLQDPFLQPHDYEWAVWQRLAGELEAVDEFGEPHQHKFKTYVDSCYSFHPREQERIWREEVRAALAEMGTFRALAPDPLGPPDFTRLFLGLIQQHSPLVLDVLPDVDDYNTSRFALKVAPPGLLEDPFHTEDPAAARCRAEAARSAALHAHDLGGLYAALRACLRDSSGRVEAAAEALLKLGLFDGAVNETQKRADAVHSFSNYIADIENSEELGPRVGRLQRLQARVYRLMTLPQLGELFPLVDWPALTSALLGRALRPDEPLQVYFPEYLRAAARLIAASHTSRWDANDALLTAFAEARLRQLLRGPAAVPGAAEERRCERTAAALMEASASALFLQAVGPAAIGSFAIEARRLFGDLRAQLGRELAAAAWLPAAARARLAHKLARVGLQLESCHAAFNDSDRLNAYMDRYEMNETNFVSNSMALLRRYRRLMYASFDENPSDPHNIWSHIQVPYATTARASYPLNAIVLPLGLLAPPLFHPAYPRPLQLAGLGLQIAHELAHHFDSVGLGFGAAGREEGGLLEGAPAAEYADMLAGLTHWMEYPATRQWDGDSSIGFQFEESAKEQQVKAKQNEMLADLMGVRLAYRAMAGAGEADPAAQERLPFLPLPGPQAFFLHLAQGFCTKQPLVSVATEIFENEHFPPQIRVQHISMFSSDFDEAFGCGKRSGVPVFPQLGPPLGPAAGGEPPSELRVLER